MCVRMYVCMCVRCVCVCMYVSAPFTSTQAKTENCTIIISDIKLFFFHGNYTCIKGPVFFCFVENKIPRNNWSSKNASIIYELKQT